MKTVEQAYKDWKKVCFYDTDYDTFKSGWEEAVEAINDENKKAKGLRPELAWPFPTSESMK